MIKNVYVKFNYDQLRIDKALGNFQKSVNNNNDDVRSVWGEMGSPKKNKL